jgi:hypothetical protein
MKEKMAIADFSKVKYDDIHFQPPAPATIDMGQLRFYDPELKGVEIEISKLPKHKRDIWQVMSLRMKDELADVLKQVNHFELLTAKECETLLACIGSIMGDTVLLMSKEDVKNLARASRKLIAQKEVAKIERKKGTLMFGYSKKGKRK